MKTSRTKTLARLKAHQGKPSSIRFMRQMGEGLMAFRQGEKALLTTSDDELPAVIGECEAEGLNSIPPAMAAWLEETAREVADYQAKPKPKGIVKAKATADTEPPKGRVSVKPLIKAVWGQSSPYNQNLKFDGKLSHVGCNAVAMSMLMLYWHEQGYDRGCLPTPGYTSKTNGYKIPSQPPLTIFDYGNMTEGKPATDAQKAAVAGLCQHIGYALKSDYTPNGTLAYMGDVVTVFNKYLRMGNPCWRIYANKGYDAFERQVYEELAAGRPVIMAGYTVNGAGHCFLCDGYDAARDMYHINWGWSGQCNGYFRMSALDATSARAYNSNKVAIIGIAPTYKLGDVNGDGEVTITDAMAVMEAAAQGSTDPKADVNSDGEVTITDAMVVMEAAAQGSTDPKADVNSDGKVTNG